MAGDRSERQNRMLPEFQIFEVPHLLGRKGQILKEGIHKNVFALIDPEKLKPLNTPIEEIKNRKGF